MIIEDENKKNQILKIKEINKNKEIKKPIIKLIRLIFDLNETKIQLKFLGYDIKRLPLS